jgi:hypothetical protein
MNIDMRDMVAPPPSAETPDLTPDSLSVCLSLSLVCVVCETTKNAERESPKCVKLLIVHFITNYILSEIIKMLIY